MPPEIKQKAEKAPILVRTIWRLNTFLENIRAVKIKIFFTHCLGLMLNRIRRKVFMALIFLVSIISTYRIIEIFASLLFKILYFLEKCKPKELLILIG